MDNLYYVKQIGVPLVTVCVRKAQQRAEDDNRIESTFCHTYRMK